MLECIHQLHSWISLDEAYIACSGSFVRMAAYPPRSVICRVCAPLHALP